jgi:hypothetical protein
LCQVAAFLCGSFESRPYPAARGWRLSGR